MPQITQCPHCNKALQIPDGAAGKPIRCPFCKQLFAIRAAPALQPAAVGAAATPSVRPAPRPESPPPARPAFVPPSRAPVAKPSAPPPGPSACPACQAPLLPGATACAECGYLLQDGAPLEKEEAPNLCPNPACGVANPAGQRVCQRCGSPLPTPAGTLLHGRYRIDKLLAIGGFSAVYLAQDTRQGDRPVAIKDMVGGDASEFGIRLGFFQREAEILRALASLPVVPRLFDFVHEGQTAYLVMEYIRGQDMLKLLEASGNRPFPFEQVVEWGKSLCDVLAHMHSLSPPVVHRDVKPENVMLLEDRRSIKMIDFGTARDMGRSHKTRLAAKTRVYTEGYAPPEQILGKPEVRSDLFALAGTLYHLATGKAPEGFYTARELQAQLAQANGALPAEQRWFYELITINLAEDVNDRYFSCAEFKADLQQRRVTKDVACPQCRAANPPRQPYCAKCAAPLTPPGPACGRCGHTNRLGCRCCILCGERLR
jgi:predicted Ser/Thr protein kinase